MGNFQTTSWSLVLHTRADEPRARAALEQLCRVYRPPVLAFVRAHGVSGVEAEDLTQAFFAHFLEQELYARADPTHGRFRNLLLIALRRFLANAGEFERALKRGGRVAIESLDDRPEGADPAGEGATPERAFELQWAATLIERSVERLRAESERAGKLPLFDRLKEFLLEKPVESDYERVAGELGMRRNTLTVAVHRLRHELREQIRAEVAETAGSDEDLEVELGALRATLGGAH